MHQRDLAAEFPGPQVVVEVIKRCAEEFASHELIVTPTSRLTFAEVDQASRDLAKRLIAAGVGKGSRVGAHLPHGPEWIVAFFAVTRIGAIFMPFSAAYKPAELRRALRLGDVHLLLASTESWHGGPYAAFMAETLPELGSESTPIRCAAAPYLREIWLLGDSKPRADDLPSWARAVALSDPAPETVSDELLIAVEDQVRPADEALIIWTSGTTADPKGATHSQGTLARRAKANAHSHAFVEGDRVFCDYAFWWVGGPGYGFLPAIWVGATTLAVAKHSRDTTEAFLARERPTRVAGRLAADIATRVVVADEGSAHMVTPRGIGMTETFGPHSMFDPETLLERRGSRRSGLGPAILGFERKLIDPITGAEVAEAEPGELLVRGPGMMLNLYGCEPDEVFDADGWYHTGDICRIVDDIIHFVSRSGEMIKTSGSNVAPIEVESVLLAMPEVEEPAVFGLPEPKRGEQVVAVIQAVAGADLDEANVRDAVRSELSNYKVPRHVWILEDGQMPRLHSGKPDKAALRAMMAARLDDPPAPADRSEA